MKAIILWTNICWVSTMCHYYIQYCSDGNPKAPGIPCFWRAHKKSIRKPRRESVVHRKFSSYRACPFIINVHSRSLLIYNTVSQNEHNRTEQSLFLHWPCFCPMLLVPISVNGSQKPEICIFPQPNLVLPFIQLPITILMTNIYWALTLCKEHF